MSEIAQLVFNGVSIGCIYALIGLGFIFAINGVRVVNLAHGEVMMLGGFFAVTAVQYLKLPLFLSYIIALAATLSLGYVLQLVILRPLIGKPFFTVMVATIGLSIMLSNLAMNIWGPNSARLPGPFGIEVVRVGGVVMGKQNLFAIATLVIVLCLQVWFFRNTATGHQMRAMSELPEVARLLGVRVGRLTAITFMVSAGLAGLAGILMGPLYFVSFSMGSIALMKGFTATIIGGFGRVEGTVIGGLVLGIVETMMATYVSPTFKDGFAFMVLVLVLLVRPQGILGESFSQRV